MSINYDYTKRGRVKKIDTMGGNLLPDYEYEYGDGSADTNQFHKTATLTGTSNTTISTYSYDGSDRLDHVLTNAVPSAPTVIWP